MLLPSVCFACNRKIDNQTWLLIVLQGWRNLLMKSPKWGWQRHVSKVKWKEIKTKRVKPKINKCNVHDWWIHNTCHRKYALWKYFVYSHGNESDGHANLQYTQSSWHKYVWPCNNCSCTFSIKPKQKHTKFSPQTPGLFKLSSPCSWMREWETPGNCCEQLDIKRVLDELKVHQTKGANVSGDHMQTATL